MFDEELKCKKLKNEIQDLNDWIFELDEERKVAEANKKVVREKYYDTVSDAQYRLHRWHQEREKRRDAENKMAELDKHAKKMKCTLICWRTSMKSHQIPSVQCSKSGMTRRQLGIMVEGNDGPHG